MFTSLIPALHGLLPNVEHRFCWRHLYGNLAKKHRGKQLRDEMWAAAKATTVADWKKHMKKISVINPDAHKVIEKMDPTTWARFAFSPRSKCNSLLNNMSESFNAFILENRDKPIITCMDMIRESLIVRMQEKRQALNGYKGRLCPNIQKKLKATKGLTRNCIALWAADNIFEVKTISNKFIVNLSIHTCNCKKWDFTGLPCQHAISAIFLKK